MFTSIVIALLLKFWGQEFVLNLYFYDYAACPSSTCAGNQAVYRLSFSLLVFFLTMFLAMLTPATSSLHHTMWFPKVIYYLVLIIFSFLLPNDFYSGYSYLCRVASGIFLLLQIVALIDSFYIWNETWVKKDRKLYYAGLLVVSLLLYAASFTFLGLGYDWFASGPSCGLQRFFLSFSYVLIVGFTLLSISNVSEHGALLPSALVGAYCTWLNLTGLNSDPSSCNSLYHPNDTNVGVLLTGLALAAVSITWSSWRLATSKNLFRTQQEEKDDIEMVNRKVEGGEEVVEEEAVLQDPITRRSNMIFHGMMMLGAMYMSMLLTSWASDVVSGNSKNVSVSAINMWVNIVTEWVCALLYSWTLLAPAILTNREF